MARTSPAMTACESIVTFSDIMVLTFVLVTVTFPPISLIEGRVLETHLNMERVRFLRAGLVTPLPGGPGIVPAGIMTGARGASLKRE